MHDEGRADSRDRGATERRRQEALADLRLYFKSLEAVNCTHSNNCCDSLPEAIVRIMPTTQTSDFAPDPPRQGTFFWDAKGRQFNALPVVVTNVEISFGQSFALLVTFGLAAIPAGIVLGIVYFLIGLGLSAAGLSVFPHPSL